MNQVKTSVEAFAWMLERPHAMDVVLSRIVTRIKKMMTQDSDPIALGSGLFIDAVNSIIIEPEQIEEERIRAENELRNKENELKGRLQTVKNLLATGE